MTTISADFPFKANYIEVHGSKMHYVDEGSGDPILFLHGNPTSSYLWRNIIPYLTPHDRCIAPDLIGMGKSDKPDIEYSFFDHVHYIDGFIDALGLKNITLVIHDWGSGLGFHYAMRHESNIKAVAFMEAILLPLPDWNGFPPDSRELFQAFRTPDVGWDMIVNQNIFVEQLLPQAVVRGLTKAEMDHYRAPFTDPASRKPVWRWPNEIPIAGKPADVTAAVNAYNQKFQQSDLPKLLFYATPGGIMTAPVVEWCRQHLKNLETVDLGQGIHYLQEDHPDQIGTVLAEWYQTL
ncbi:MAG: haloalkane dehalogenase [Anaerolineae bacterium]|nr:haloalkane dehalogenase [Anaerolineae bacterium]